MSKNTWICKHYASLYNTDDVVETVTTECDYVSLTELLEAFERHLRGCGFVFNGHLEIVDDENPADDDQ